MDRGLVDEIVELVAHRLARNVVLDDPASRLVAYASVSESIDRPRLHHLLMKVSIPEVRPRQAEANTRVEPFILPPDEQAGFFGRLGVPLMDSHHHVGTLWVQAQDYDDPLRGPLAQLSEVRPQLEQLAVHLGQELDQRHQAVDREFIEALMDGDTVHAEQLIGRRLSPGWITVVLIPIQPLEARWPAAEARQRILTRLLLTLGGWLRTGYVGGADENHAVLTIPGDVTEASLYELLSRACTYIGDEMPVAGLGGGFAKKGSAPESYRRAVTAAQATAVDPTASADAAAVGVYQHLANGVECRDWGRLQHLLEAPEAEVLLETLEAIYDFPGPKAELASRLFLHRATLYNRMERIARLIGADPNDPQVRLDLHVALKIRRWSRRPLPDA